MPYTRSKNCVYKKKADGSRGEKKGCSDSEEEAKQYMKRLYSLGEMDSELLDEDEVEDDINKSSEGMRRNEQLVRLLIRELFEQPAQHPAVNSEKRVADALTQLILQDSRFVLGRRASKVQRIYPADPGAEPKLTIDDLEKVVQFSITAGDPAGKYEIVPPKSSKFGFNNPSSKFDMILVAPSPGKITHPQYKEGDYIPIMLAGGARANVGQAYEDDMAAALQDLTVGGTASSAILGMLDKIGLAPRDMAGATVTQTKPSKRPVRPVPYDVGPQIADIIIAGAGAPRYISVKNVKGKTFGNHGYGGGFTVKKSRSGYEKIVSGVGPGDTDQLVAALGIDKAKVARGVTNYLNQNEDVPEETVVQQGGSSIDPQVIQSWLASGIGFGYYYVREGSAGSIKVLHLKDASDAMDFVGKVAGVILRYPRAGKSKQLTALVATANGTFKIELRNTSGGIVPNQLNFSVGSNFIPPASLLERKAAMNRLGGTLIRKLIREIFLFEDLAKSSRV